MPLYAYKALDENRVASQGSLTAANEREARAQLKAQGLYATSLKAQSAALDWRALLRLRTGPTMNARDLATFCRQFATLLEATIPYDAALEMIVNQTEDEALKGMMADVRARVMEGVYLADALGQYPACFPPMVVSMVRSGEASGTLVTILGRLADYYENMARLRGRVRSALTYPMFMVVFAFAVVIFMVTYIIPKITKLIENFGGQLPLSTRILIGFSTLLTDYWWAVIIVGGGLGYWAMRYLRTPGGQEWWDSTELKLPVWGKLRRKMLMQRFAQTLATLIKSGVELKDALNISSEVLENRQYRKAMEGVILDVQNKGLPLAVALKRSGMFPEDLVRMVAIGENTATLENMLENQSRAMAQEVTNTIEAAMSLLEPVMILSMGGIIGFIVISVLLPMMQLNQLAR